MRQRRRRRHAAADAWKRLNIIAEAYISDGHHVTIARTTHAPIEEVRERLRARRLGLPYPARLDVDPR